ncbi:MAG: EVE domain-containing protein [Dehalococcoidales bacterium]|nr:EVE domain-containing protein [Dehalococcoidales bacterium]
MAYYLDLFSPETYKAFSESARDVSGFRLRQKNAARKVKIGDKLLCYITGISRWVGILEVTSSLFEDSTPRFYKQDDPFSIRFKVLPIVLLPFEHAIPIHEDYIWNSLSFTKNCDKKKSNWTGPLRVSLREFNREDALFLEKSIINQSKNPKIFPLSEDDNRRIRLLKIRTKDNIEVNVSVPADTESYELPKEEDSDRNESKKIQALIAEIGDQMGLKIWIPKSDRTRVLEHWIPSEKSLLDELPLNYDETTIKTIEQIDVIWIKGRSIIRAFEVEHTTSIYSGILRMADLMSLQPNLTIHAHIVAPYERKDKVFDEIKRPVFALLEKGPLSQSCTFLSYDSLKEIAKQKHLSRMSDSVLDDYAEEATEEQ